MKRLSVIIPGYNTTEKWWRRCVESVCAACGPEDEIICVDDGSQVKPTFLNEIARLDNRFRVLLLDVNGGPGCARNAALGIANGRYVTFVDSDDAVYGDALVRCVAKMAECSCDVGCYGVKTVWDVDGMCKVDVLPEKSYGELSPKDVLEISRLNLFNYVWNKVYSQKFLRDNNIRFEPDVDVKKGDTPWVFGGEDNVFNLRCVMAGARWCSVADCGYIYYRPRTTLLSRYKPTAAKGARMVSNVWREYKEKTSNATAVLGDFGELSPSQELWEEWRNIWMPGTPFGLIDRWRWLRLHPQVGGFVMFVKTAAFIWLRRHCYWRCVRRWNIRRSYPMAREWHGEIL